MSFPSLPCSWALAALALAPVGLGAAGSEPAAATAAAALKWQSAPPFSFNYGGKPSSEFLSKWETSGDLEGSTGTARRIAYVDPITRLKVTAEIRTFPDFDAVEWVLEFRNDGTADTPLIDNILPLDWSVAGGGGCILHHAHGSTAKASDFQPLNEPLVPGKTLTLQSENGLSSSGDTLPFFNLQLGDHGVIGAIGWTGNWKAAFTLGKTAIPQVAVTSGMVRTHLLLHAGEEIRTPRILLLNWTGGDWQAAQNLWRRLVLAHYAPKIDDRPLVFVGSWGSEPVARKIALLDLLQDSRLPYDAYTIDAGWFGRAEGETEPMNEAGATPWWKFRGDWSPSPITYPEGLGPVGRLLQKYGRGFSLWVEPETAVVGSDFFSGHPGWFLPSLHPRRPDTVLLNLGNPAARQGAVDLISDLITADRVTWYRQDFNIAPAPYWSLADAPDRIGMTEIRHIEGLYAFWDELRSRHPGLKIDNCASGGRRLDLEMMARSFSIWRSDFGNASAAAEEMQTQALSQWVPLNMSYESLWTTKPWLAKEPFGTAAQLYAFRSGYGAGLGINAGPPLPANRAWLNWLKAAVEEYREVEPYFYGDFYPLLPYTLEENAWTAWQWDRPDLKAGLVLILRRPESLHTAMELALRGLVAQGSYAVEIRRPLGQAKLQVMSGEELSQLKISLAEKPSSVVIIYRLQPGRTAAVAMSRR